MLRLRSKARYWSSKWPIADLINRSKRACWADLVTWALWEGGGDQSEKEYHRLRSNLNGGGRCLRESREHPDRTCYCGKFDNGELRKKTF